MLLPPAEEALYVLARLEAAGFDAWLVGGCVRDLVRGEAPADYDIASACPPARVTELFAKVIATGLKHGTVTVLCGDRALEVTMFRTESGYSDGRRPDSVVPARRIEDDLARRDFTVNAMAWQPGRGLCDPFGGRLDLEAKRIRAVGDPAARFGEDALRILRAFRFSSRLDFDIEESTLRAALVGAGGLSRISAERIFAELKKTLGGVRPDALAPLIAAGGLMRAGLPAGNADLSPIRRLPADVPHQRNTHSSSATVLGLSLRFTALCRIAGAQAADVCAALKADKAFARACARIVEAAALPPPNKITEVRRRLSEFPADAVRGGLWLREALYSEPPEQALAWIDEAEALRQPVRIADLRVRGGDILALGCPPSMVGAVLRALLERVLEDPARNERDMLLTQAKRFIEEGGGI